MLRNFVILILTGFIFATAVKPAIASSNDTASFFIKRIGNEGIAILSNTEPNTKEQTERFREFLLHNFDTQVIGRFVLGYYWRSMTPTQKAEYKQLFEEYIVIMYTVRFGKYVGASIEIKREYATVDTNNIVVYSFVSIQSDVQPIQVLWNVQKKNGSFKILDIVVEGISMAVTLRSEFTSVIRRNGRSIDVFLNILREKIKTQK